MEHETFDVLMKFLSFGLFVGQGGASHKRIKAKVTCLDQDFFFFWGGGVGGMVRGQLLENSLNNVFFHQLLYSLQRGSDCLSMLLFQRKLLFPGFRGSSIINPEGSTIFQGVQLFPGWGIQMLFSIETHITCEFSAGGGGGGRAPPPSGSAHE